MNIVVSAANDAYLHLLEGMLASIAGKLTDFDLGIVNLGLSDSGKERIAAHKADAHIARAEWRRAFPGIDKVPEYKKIFISKPYIPEMFPGYDNYVWVDADVWFQNAGGLDDYVEASEKTGAAFSFEAHPTYRSTQKVRTLDIFGVTIIKNIKDYFLTKRREMFGTRVAAKIGMHSILNSGLFCMAAESPVWRAWQEKILAANLGRQHRRTQICDQTCLQMALIQRELSYAVMPATHNWIPGLSAPLVDAETFTLLDTAWPHLPIKAVHLMGIKNSKFELPVTDGRRIGTGLQWADFLELKAGVARGGLTCLRSYAAFQYVLSRKLPAAVMSGILTRRTGWRCRRGVWSARGFAAWIRFHDAEPTLSGRLQGRRR